MYMDRYRSIPVIITHTVRNFGQELDSLNYSCTQFRLFFRCGSCSKSFIYNFESMKGENVFFEKSDHLSSTTGKFLPVFMTFFLPALNAFCQYLCQDMYRADKRASNK